MPSRLPIAALWIALLPAAAAAEPLVARYAVTAAGVTVIEVDALVDLDGPRYVIRSRIRLRGMLGWLASGDQVTSTEGGWRGAEAVPVRYRVEGTWRGDRRLVAMDYTPAGLPVLRAIEPANDDEREPVPEALQRGTVDALSALAKLSRTVAQTGRCDVAAEVYDGRRRVDYGVRTVVQETLPAEGGFAGPALRCAVESRLVAGARKDQDAASARRPQPATVWLGRPLAGSGPLPVRLELPSRWFGSIRASLLAVEPATASTWAGVLAEPRR